MLVTMLEATLIFIIEIYSEIFLDWLIPPSYNFNSTQITKASSTKISRSLEKRRDKICMENIGSSKEAALSLQSMKLHDPKVSFGQGRSV